MAGEPLAVEFFTIVLNGMPFLRHQAALMEVLPFPWRWHFIEGVGDLVRDTGWSLAAGGSVPPAFHREGLSVDGTTGYLDDLAKRFPQRVFVHRKPHGRFWDGKLEMVNAPLPFIDRPCLLWQVDADELWTARQLEAGRELFIRHPRKTAALFYCHFFVADDLVIANREVYGNHWYEWRRAWRCRPGDRWKAHEPPILTGRRGWRPWRVQLHRSDSFTRQETEAAGLVFQHMAYVVEEQLAFKESYYGYAGAVAAWKRMRAASPPLRLADHLPWVKDEARVERAGALGIRPLARRGPGGDWLFSP